MEKDNWDYLGDGVYAGHDGYHIWLHVGSQRRAQPERGLAHDNPTDRVALEPEVWEALVRYVERRKVGP